MRNYSFVSEVNFLSCSINLGEYVNHVSVDHVLQALATAFGSPYSHVQHDFKIVCLGDDGADLWPRLNSSEYNVLKDLFEFAKKIGELDPWAFQSLSFVYVNLNTGARVVWVHTQV